MYEIILTRPTITYSQKYHNYHLALESSFLGFSQRGTEVRLQYNKPLSEEVQAAIQLADVQFVDNDPFEYVMTNVVGPARAFGQQMIDDYVCENILLGITQDGMTTTVRKTMKEVSDCLETGSLYDAIAEVRLVPVEKRDAKYMSNERLLKFINKVEKYLKIPLSSSL